ncbi:hypothetical protein GUJ93_ZPchr0002g24373 [Zizania palustris]|uniref:Myb-like domain-containing protein n=1 Tax=Zizania palustris TaxID=103762 RepID=A0A8J5S5Q3_ZIZPA|nr:hypothetical protein GUJ93_ZPchr0002g24373 [Zizania palustris]
MSAKFRLKARTKPCKTSLPSRPVHHPIVEPSDETVGTLNEDNASQKHSVDQETSLLAYRVSEIIGDAFTSAVDKFSQNEEHNNNLSHGATNNESMVVSDTQTPATCSNGKTIDDLADIEGLCDDTQIDKESVAKFQPKIRAKISKAAPKSWKTKQKAGASSIDVVSINKEDCKNQAVCNNEQLHTPRHHETVQITYSQEHLQTHSHTINEFSNCDRITEGVAQEEMTTKFQSKLQQKSGEASPSVVEISSNAVVASDAGVFVIDVISQDTVQDSHREGLNGDLCQEHMDEEAITVSDTWPPQDVDSTVDLDSHAEMINPHSDGSLPIIEEPSVEATVKFQPYVRRKKGKEKLVSFVLPNVSDALAPTDTNSEMSSFTHFCKDIVNDENLNNSLQQAVEKQPKSVGRETGTSMKLRSREKLQKVGIPEHTADDNMDEDFVESSSPEQDNDSGNEYTASGKQKLRGNLREKNINKEPLKGIKRTSRSKDSIIEESQKQKLQKNKSKASSGDQKKTSKDSSVEQSEKKLSHRIRQKRMKEVKTLLETPDHEIDPMKLSVTHLRLLQEARERIKGKEIPSGPFSSNRSSSQFGDMDYGYNEQEIYDDDRVENHVLENATKLNYHSYMNKQARAKWSKSDTNLFYQGLRQFGSDFAMIQHLFPDKTRNQNMLGDFINEEEDNGSNWSDKEPDMHVSEVEEKDHVSTNADGGDDLGDVFDWY